MEGSEYSYSCSVEGSGLTSRKKRNKNKRRFSEEQIRSLESMFENETRLEPRKKVQLATDLGLHPRQVAIWFQNKRARYKSKQLERDCDVLRANYNNLASRFENLKKEKQALLLKLQKLNDLINKSQGEGQDLEGNSNKVEFEEKQSSGQGTGLVSEGDESTKTDYFAVVEEPCLVEPADSSLTSAEDWGSFEFDQSSSSYQWWDFWS